MAAGDVLLSVRTGRRPGAPPSALVAAGLLASGVVVVTAAVVVLGRGDVPLPGLPDAGPVTALGLPVARVAHHVLAAGTVGSLLLHGVLLPSPGRDRTRQGAGGSRVVAAWAAGWAAATLVWAVLWLSEELAVPVADLPARDGLLAVALASPFVLAQVSALWLALVVAVGVGVVARGRPSLLLTRVLLLVALVALLPTTVTGHAGTHGEPVLGVAAVSVHVVSVVVWVGGLLAVVVHLRDRNDLLAVALPRFSRVALVCVVLLTVSGVLAAWSVLGASGEGSGLRRPGLEVSSAYGAVLLTKVALLGVLVGVGAVHRRRTLAAAVAGRPHALLRLAAGELAVMGTAVGLAVVLAASTP